MAITALEVASPFAFVFGHWEETRDFGCMLTLQIGGHCIFGGINMLSSPVVKLPRPMNLILLRTKQDVTACPKSIMRSASSSFSKNCFKVNPEGSFSFGTVVLGGELAHPFILIF